MRSLEANEWIFLSSLIYGIESEPDEEKMRRDFLEKLTGLVSYDSADFFLCRDQVRNTEELQDWNRPMDQGQKAEHGGLYRPVFYRCAEDNDLSEQYDVIDYSRGILYSGKSVVYRDTDVLSDQERVRTEYFRRIYLPNHWHYSMQMIFAYEGRPLGAATLYRLKGKKDFSYDDVFLLDSIKDHVSLRLYRDYLQEREKERRREETLKKPTVAAAAARYHLTGREQTVLRCMMDGKENAQIARELSITVSTLKKHILSVYRKIGVKNRIGLFKAVREEE